MRLSLLIVFFSLCAGILPALASDQRVETDHLVFMWEDDAVTEDGLEMAKAKGEEFYAAIHGLLGYEPPSKVVVLLRGPAEQPDGSWGYPRVDGLGRIHLFQFAPNPESYFNAFAHEMVHVFRFQRKPHHDWFLEEGFAEFVARRADTSMDGFPWYGFPVTVVAGQWLASGEDIPLATLRDNHKRINLPCKLQSYSLRAAFFVYLGDTYGDEKVLELAGQEKAGDVPDYERFFGKSFKVLESDWREALLKEYAEVEDVEELSRQYRKESPAQYIPVCRQGEDF